MSVGTDNLSPNLPQSRNLLFRQGGVEGVGKKKSIAVEGSAAGTEGAQRGGLGGEGMAVHHSVPGPEVSPSSPSPIR